MNKQLLILVCGHITSGKTTLSKKIESAIHLNKVNGDIIRDMLVANINFYTGTNFSYCDQNCKTMSANKVTALCRYSIIKELLSQGQSVLVDGGGINKEKRNQYIQLAKGNGHKIITIIIEAVAKEKVLLARLKKRDSQNKQHRWFDFYKRHKKYEPVDSSEADFILTYNQNNRPEIIKTIKSIGK